MADEHSSVAEPATDPRTDGDAAVALPRPERLAGRGDVRAVPERSGLGERELARLLRGLPLEPSPTRDRSGSRGRSTPAPPPPPAVAAAPAPPAAPLPAAAPPRPPRPRAAPVGKPILGAGALIVANMERSLGVPTATSFRDVPAKLLEVNRKVINGFLGRSGAGKISFTHLIAYAVVRTIADDMPVMSATFVEDAEGKPRVVHHDHVNVGIAVDMEKSDGTRTLVVPVIKQADTLDFAGFRNAYEDLVRGPRPASSRSPTSRAPPSRSPTRAPSAPSSRCPA